MERVPFSPDGVKRKQAELYALTDARLAEQADLLRDDLKAWVRNNFQLTTDQETYLSGMEPRAISFLSCEVSCTLRRRLPIDFGIEGIFKSSKFFKCDKSVSATIAKDGTVTVGGGLTLTTVYE